MLADSLSEAVSYAALASLAFSITSLACILYFKKSKTSYN